MANGEKKKNLLYKWFVDAFGAMALGVFASLLMGTILGQIGKWTNISFFTTIAGYAQEAHVVGAAIGVAVANGLKVKPLVMLSGAVCGAIGYCSGGGPIGAYLASLVGSELSELVAGKTPFDILLIPAVSIISGGFVGVFVGPYVQKFCNWIGQELCVAMGLKPVLMGIVISVVMGLALTAPISSAAISITIFTETLFSNNPSAPIVAGVATVGCCCQMMGFAVSSWRENGFGGFIAQGLGTSMLQVANIVQHPLILIPPTLASAILGPLAATVLKVENALGVYGGMGTCGLVGPAGMWGYMMPNGFDMWTFVKIMLMCFILPMLLSWGISEGMRKMGLIKNGNMKLDFN